MKNKILLTFLSLLLSVAFVWAQKKISDYPNTATAANTDQFILARPGVTNYNQQYQQLTAQIQTNSPLHPLGSYGANIVPNGDFAVDFTGWTGTNWAWNAGTALHTGGSDAWLNHTNILAVVGTTYRVTFSIVGASPGSVYVFFGGCYGSLSSGVSAFTNYLTATSTNALGFVPTSDFVGAVDNVSIEVMSGGSVIIDGPTDIRSPLTIHDGILTPNGTPIRFGYNALANNTKGSLIDDLNPPGTCVAIGEYAGYANTSGHVTAVGYYAGYRNTTGALTAFGKWAGYNNTDGHATFVGNAAGFGNTTSESVAVGDEAAHYNQTADLVAVGYYAAHYASNINVTAIGYLAAKNGVSANKVTAVGYTALQNNLTTNCTAVGHEAGYLSTNGIITAVGYRALYNNQTGSATAVGNSALLANTTGDAVAVGHSAGQANTTGKLTAVGYQAGYANIGGFGAYLGYQAGYSSTSGSATGVGYKAATYNTTGNLIALGYDAGAAQTGNDPATDVDGILIGQIASRSVATATKLTNYVGIGAGVLIDKSNQIKLGNSAIIETVLNGAIIVPTLATEPSAPASGTIAFYGATNGSGKLVLVAKFPGGGTNTFATEP